MASTTTNTAKQLQTDLSPVLKVYTDGTVERLMVYPNVPPSQDQDPATGVRSKDICTINPPARLYLPTNPTDQKVPILIYFHGGAFCVGSAFSQFDHRLLNILSSQSEALIVSVEYRLAPEQPLPAAYDDAWAALTWVCSHAIDQARTHPDRDPWITSHGDLGRLFIGGDSAGANIVHCLSMRAGSEPLPGNVKISGALLSHPYFWGSIPIGSEPKEDVEQHICRRLWVCAYPDAERGIDNPVINPIVDGAPSLAGLGCERMMVCVSEKDILKSRAIAYVEKVRESGWGGHVEVVEVEGEDHCFHYFTPDSDKAKDLIKRMASFISQ